MNSSNQQAQILILEPEAILAEITQFRLELLGYQVRCVASPEEALLAIEISRPDILMVDLNLPELRGNKFVEQLSSNPETNSILILALSIDADIESVQQAYSAGAADYLVAPYLPSTLEEKVAKLVERSRQRKDRPERVTAATT